MNLPKPELTPFFVYGTLRPGGFLSYLWFGRAIGHHDGKARMPGARLVTSVSAGYPYALPDPTGEVVGTLLWPKTAADEAELVELFDHVEGHPHHYVRRLVTVRHPGVFRRRTQAWAYFASADTEDRLRVRLVVPGNDWSKWVTRPARETEWRASV